VKQLAFIFRDRRDQLYGHWLALLKDQVGDEYLESLGAALDTPVSSVMTSDVLSVGRDTEMPEIVELMLEYKVGAIPVVDGDNELVGIVSYMDVLREVAEREGG